MDEKTKIQDTMKIVDPGMDLNEELNEVNSSDISATNNCAGGNCVRGCGTKSTQPDQSQI